MLRILLLLTVWGGFSGAGIAYNRYSYFSAQLPENLSALRDEPDMATLVYSADGELIGEFYLEKRVVVPLERIPEHVRQAFISAEDRRFWEHPGFDIFGIARAAVADVTTGQKQQGASTITQQVTRMILLSNEKTIDRKIKELILALRVERELTKREILEIYLNRVYLGHGAHGVQAAAETYFGKDVDHLTVAESALLAGLVQRPAAYDPMRNLKLARWRQSYVIERMRKDGYISNGEARAALAEPLALVEDDTPLNHVAAPYFVEQIRKWVEARFGEKSVFNGGLRIYTTLDMRMQRGAEAAVRAGLENLDRRIGFRGAIGHLDPAALAAFARQRPRPYLPGEKSAALGGGANLLPEVRYVGAVTELPRRGGVLVAVGNRRMPMARDDARALRRWHGDWPTDDKGKRVRGPRPTLQVGDELPVRLVEGDGGDAELELAQLPEVQGALVAVDPHTGGIRSMVGGYDFQQSQFNRAVQGNRQIGSAIKPFIYATALAAGMSPLDIVPDQPITVRTAGGLWSPSNYEGTFEGPVTLRTALAKSINTVAVRLILKVGVEAVIETMRSMGIRSPIPLHPSIALGTADLDLIEVVCAYAAFDNGGRLLEGQDELPDTPPGRMVDLITDADGTIVADYRARLPRKQAISPALAYEMVDLLKAPVERGTSRKAQELGRPVAGKTGTATMWKDAWFLGFSPELVAGVWVGRDDSKPIGVHATGAAAALPIWLDFMKAALSDRPAHDFPIPDNITLVRANDRTGQPAAPGAPGSRWVPFLRGTVPARFEGRIKTGTFSTTGDFVPSARSGGTRHERRHHHGHSSAP